MPTDCNPALFDFPPVEGRRVVASFDGGAITSDAGALLLGQTDRAMRLTERFTACFADVRTLGLVEHQVETLVMQRVIGIALGYEDLNDHDELRRDPVLAVLAGKLAAQRSDCAPLAGKSTLNRLELSQAEPTRYRKISHNPRAIESLFVNLFLGAHKKAPKQITLDLDATDDPLYGNQEGRFFHGYYDCYCYLPTPELKLNESALEVAVINPDVATSLPGASVGVIVPPIAVWNTPEPDASNALTGALKLVSLVATTTVTWNGLVLISDVDEVLRISSGAGLAGVPTEVWIEVLMVVAPRARRGGCFVIAARERRRRAVSNYRGLTASRWHVLGPAVQRQPQRQRQQEAFPPSYPPSDKAGPKGCTFCAPRNPGL
jgi:hypothetical protein